MVPRRVSWCHEPIRAGSRFKRRDKAAPGDIAEDESRKIFRGGLRTLGRLRRLGDKLARLRDALGRAASVRSWAMSEGPEQTPSHDADDVTRLLSASAEGDSSARDRLVEAVYAEIHRMARGQMRGERAGHTLGATGLVHETLIRLFKQTGDGGAMAWGDRRAFFSAAATAMRRVLVDHARARATVKRGGGDRPLRIELDSFAAANSISSADFLALDEAISRLEEADARAADVVRLRFYAGREIKEVADLLGVSDRTVKRDWEFARAWLFESMHDAGPGERKA